MACSLQSHDLFFYLFHFYMKLPSLWSRSPCLGSATTSTVYPIYNLNSSFQFLDDRKTMEKEVDNLCNTGIGYTETPLWRLLVTPPCKVRFSPFGSLHSHEYDIYFRFHRAFLDRTSMIFCLGCFANVIHKATTGEYIDARAQLGMHVSGKEGNNLRDAVKEFLTKDVDALEIKKSNIKSCNKIPLILEAFSPPGGSPRSKHIYKCLLPTVFKRFSDQCDKCEVTLNSGLHAAINTGLVELVKEAGINQETYKISATWNSDIRRFIPPHHWGMLGFHETPVVCLMSTPQSVREIFWSYAKKLDEQFHLFYGSGEDFQQLVLSELMEDLVHPEDYFKNKPFPVIDYAFISAGDLSPPIQLHNDHFSLSDVFMMSSAHKTNYVLCHQVNMYNNVFFYTLSYDASYVAEDTAKVLVDKVLSVIKTV